ncbi:hypothetical protein SB758_34100, partial [Burkholderia sp. SIMBA_013]
PPRAGTGSTTPWGLLEEGHDVVLEHGNYRFAGKVDALTIDRNIIWVTTDLGERRLFHSSDGYEVLP